MKSLTETIRDELIDTTELMLKLVNNAIAGTPFYRTVYKSAEIPDPFCGHVITDGNREIVYVYPVKTSTNLEIHVSYRTIKDTTNGEWDRVTFAYAEGLSQNPLLEKCLSDLAAKKAIRWYTDFRTAVAKVCNKDCPISPDCEACPLKQYHKPVAKE